MHRNNSKTTDKNAQALSEAMKKRRELRARIAKIAEQIARGPEEIPANNTPYGEYRQLATDWDTKLATLTEERDELIELVSQLDQTIELLHICLGKNQGYDDYGIPAARADRGNEGGPAEEILEHHVPIIVHPPETQANIQQNLERVDRGEKATDQLGYQAQKFNRQAKELADEQEYMDKLLGCCGLWRYVEEKCCGSHNDYTPIKP